MSPNAIFLYEIDESFGPKIIADFYLSNKIVSQEILKEFIDKHVSKELTDAVLKKDQFKYYSSILNSSSIKKENLYLGFILREDEDLVSLKSVFERAENKIIDNFSENKSKMKNLLKESLTSIMSLMEKLKEPKIIVETINEKTKKMLDEGKLQEARELIELGQTIPSKLATEIRIAEYSFKAREFKKAKKSFEKAAELASIIQEEEIVSFLQNKALKVGTLPELLKEQDGLMKDVKKVIIELDVAFQLRNVYAKLIPPTIKLLKISNSLEDEELFEIFTEIKNNASEADKLAKSLFSLDKNIKRLVLKLNKLLK